MNMILLKLKLYLSSPIYLPTYFCLPFVVGLMWILIIVCIAHGEIITGNQLMPGLKDPIKPPEEARQIATTLIKELEPLIQKNEDLSEELGFLDSKKLKPDKAQHLMIQEKTPGPIPVFYVSLNALQQFSSFKPPSNALTKDDLTLQMLSGDVNWSDLSGAISPRRFLFPIRNVDQIISSILVGLSHNINGWHVLKLGSPRLTQALTNSKLIDSKINYFAIEIRALNRMYLGWLSNDQLMLTAIVSDPSIKLFAGESRSAMDVFLALEKEAKTININDPAPR